MSQPSSYELDAWREIQEFTGRQVSRRLGEAGQRISESAAKAGGRASKYLEGRPQVQAAVKRGQELASKATDRKSVV